ncbi:hypothetical protein [Ferrimonas sp. YFM]|uniref:hypothetical protein n=1 Tax=Ferrimonas sp. YFM TaxID=3028878 RepID=UPI0025745E81|nr:hypothetical protein [Ferrimonas sp. YFM]
MSRYIELVKVTEKTEYGERKSVQSTNAAVDEMYAIVRAATNDELETLYELLNHSSAKRWLAHQLIECHQLPKNIENKCIEIVESLAKEDSIESFGEEMWLQEWKSKLGRA